MDSSPELKNIEVRLESLIEVLEDFRNAVADGEQVDLAGIDKEIGAVCVEAVNARPESKRVTPLLEQLVTGLDALKAELKQQFESHA